MTRVLQSLPRGASNTSFRRTGLILLSRALQSDLECSCRSVRSGQWMVMPAMMHEWLAQGPESAAELCVGESISLAALVAARLDPRPQERMC